MVRKIIRIGFIVVFISIWTGCATTSYDSTPPKSIWPSLSSSYQWQYYVPKKISSIEKAIGTIKNLEKSFVDWDSGRHFSSFDVDRYGLRAKWEWTKTKQHQTYDSGGFFLGWDYVPTGQYRTHTYQEQHKDSLIIPFPEVRWLILTYLLKENRNYKWGLTVLLEGKEPIRLRVSDKKSLWQLADSIATLSNFNFERKVLGIEWQMLTDKQSEALNLQPGIGMLVVGVGVGSPSDKAGIKFLDVILAVDGSSDEESQKIVKEISTKLAQPERKSLSLTILRDGDSLIVEVPLF